MSLNNDKAWLNIIIASELRKNNFLSKTIINMPKGNYYGYTFCIASDAITLNSDRQLNLKIDINDLYKLHRDGKEDITLTGRQLCEALKDNNASGSNNNHGREQEKEYFSVNKYKCEPEPKIMKIVIPQKGKICNWENQSLCKMPLGEYDGYSYLIPNQFAKANEDDDIILNLPEDFIITLTNYSTQNQIYLNVKDFADIFQDKTKCKFLELKSPTEIFMERFDKIEDVIDAIIPEEMKARPNWVAVRFCKDENKDKLDKYFISPVTKKTQMRINHIPGQITTPPASMQETIPAIHSPTRWTEKIISVAWIFQTHQTITAI